MNAGLRWTMFLAVGLVALPPIAFLYSEHVRSERISVYLEMGAKTGLTRTPVIGRVVDHLQPGEVLLCGLGSYGKAEDLRQLNPTQMASLPKSRIPSEDGVWYLLAFSENDVRRIMAFNAIDLEVSACGGRDDQLEILRRPNNGEFLFQLNVRSGS